MEGRGLGALLAVLVLAAAVFVPIGVLAVRYARGATFEVRPPGRRVWLFSAVLGVSAAALGVVAAVVSGRTGPLLQGAWLLLFTVGQWLERPWEPGWIDRFPRRRLLSRILLVLGAVAMLLWFVVTFADLAARRAAR